jgi:deoxyribodipyrimidine photo-lyase
MKGIQPERITTLNDAAVRNGDWVLYWMQQSQRAHDNPALEYAIHRANRLDLPVLVVFA